MVALFSLWSPSPVGELQGKENFLRGCWLVCLLVWFSVCFLGTRYLGVDGSMAEALITPCLLLIWWENNCDEENKEPSRQWERENRLAEQGRSCHSSELLGCLNLRNCGVILFV